MWRLATLFVVLSLALLGTLMIPKAGSGDIGQRPAWHEASAQKLRGKSVIVGLTYLDAAGTLDHREQLHGRITKVDRLNGIEVTLEGARAGQTYWLPPQSDHFEPAARGSYRLRSTGEEVIDPDFISNWTITKPSR